MTILLLVVYHFLKRCISTISFFILPIMFFLGAIYGGINNAPPSKIAEKAQVQKSANVAEDQKSEMILVNHKGLVRRGFGCGCEGLSGKIKTKYYRSLFEPQKTFFKSDQSQEYTSLYCSSRSKNIFYLWASYLRKIFLQKTDAFSDDEKTFIRSVVIGETGKLSQSTKDSFKRLGIFHLLVVSGFHVIMAVHVFNILFRLPFQCAYAFKILTPKNWMVVSIITEVISSVIAICYGYVVGFSSPAQRAVIIYISIRLGKAFFSQIPFCKRAVFSFFTQALLFPIGFLSESTLMSWLAYLCLIENSSNGLEKIKKNSLSKKILSSLIEAVKQQTKLTLFATACFSQLSVIGILANLLFVPLFTLIFLFTIAMPLLRHSDWISISFVFVINSFLDIVKWMADQSNSVTGLYIDLNSAHASWSAIFAAISCFIFLNLIKKIKSSNH